MATAKTSFHVYGQPLSDSDLKALGRCGISSPLAEAAGLRRVDTVDGREIVGRNGATGDYSGIIFPYTWPGSDRIREYRLRRDHPDLEVNADGKIKEKGKYLSPPGRGNRLYFAPNTSTKWLSDATLAIVVTEGEKKVLALSELSWHELSDNRELPRWLPVGVAGAWNWRGVVGKHNGPQGERQDIKGVIADFERICWKKRETIILFDANVRSDESVRVARLKLTAQLRSRGAQVRFLDLPDDDTAINGIDDFIGIRGPDAALRLFESAYDPKKHPAGPALTEEKLAQEFEATYKNQMHYDHSLKCWFVWDEKQGCWLRNERRLAFHYARTVCRSLNTEEKKEFARASTYGGVEKICQCSPEFAVSREFWDRDIWLLGVPGGTIDLRTGERLKSKREDYITRQTAVAPSSSYDAREAPVFSKFLNEITQGDEELQRYLQRIAGYSLTGSTREENLFFFYGSGGNGKSKFINAQAGAMGDYAVVATMEVFTEKRGERHTTDVAALAGARLVTASETQQGRRWDEALVGRLTGGDPVSARFMRQNNFTFVPEFTLVIAGNHAPNLTNVNDANRRRFRIIPFVFKPEKPDLKLADKLRREWPVILAWMIQGAADWYQAGLGECPKVVVRETQEYFIDQNQIQAWIDESCLTGSGFTDTSQHLYASWERWATQNGEEDRTKDWLIKNLKQQHGCQSEKVNRQRGLRGIWVKVESKTDARTGEKDES